MNENPKRLSLFTVSPGRPGRRGETVWEFLERSSDPVAAAARQQWEYWLAQMSGKPRDDLITRLRAGYEKHVRAALAELVTFVLLKAVYSEVDVDPETGTGSKTDFAVDDPVRTHLEVNRATLADKAIKDATRQHDVAEELEKLDSPDFWLSVNVRVGDQPPSMRKIRGEVEAWLSGLDYETALHLIEEESQARRSRATAGEMPGLDSTPEERARYYAEHTPYEPPTFKKSGPGWSVTISAHPRSEDSRGSGQFTVGIRSAGAVHLESIESLRRSVKGKLHQHRGLTAPLIVVLDLTSPIVGDEEVGSMLYGRTTTTMLDLDTPGATTRDRRKAIWPDPLTEPIRPAAVLILRGVWVGMVHQTTAELWLPPGAETPLRPGPWTERTLASDGRLEPPKSSHIPIGDVLAVPPSGPA